jgi:hypothetical protein
MRLFLWPLVAANLVAADKPVEPTESAMRTAFEIRLTQDVQNALAYVAETAGEEGLERVRAAGTDQFAIHSFKKNDCVASEAGHLCGFDVELAVVSGMIQQTVKGRFLAGPTGELTFRHDERITSAGRVQSGGADENANAGRAMSGDAGKTTGLAPVEPAT